MSWAIWITGLPGSGKTALARAAAAALDALGEPVRVLELDEIRKTLTPRPVYSEAERDVVYRALAYLATLLTEQRVPVIVDATAHRREWRDVARSAIPRFAEVQLVCPAEVCREREETRPVGHAPRGIYARAGRPGATVPGVDVPYEPALLPELVIDTSKEGVKEGAARIVELARTLGLGGHPEATEAAPAWAIWITGRPGSGKTTLAERVAEVVAARGTRVKVLDVATVRHFLVHGRPASEGEQEIVHRALIYGAKLLTEAGVAVIVDATGPRRAWRDAARDLIPCFAEVQLICPTEICLERERASRWGLRGGQAERHRGPSNATLPELGVVYEESLRPDLVLHTQVGAPWIRVEQVLFLIHRLRRIGSGRLEQP